MFLKTKWLGISQFDIIISFCELSQNYPQNPTLSGALHSFVELEYFEQTFQAYVRVASLTNEK